MLTTQSPELKAKDWAVEWSSLGTYQLKPNSLTTHKCCSVLGMAYTDIMIKRNEDNEKPKATT